VRKRDRRARARSSIKSGSFSYVEPNLGKAIEAGSSIALKHGIGVAWQQPPPRLRLSSRSRATAWRRAGFASRGLTHLDDRGRNEILDAASRCPAHYQIPAFVFDHHAHVAETGRLKPGFDINGRRGAGDAATNERTIRGEIRRQAV
jgi:hypothetical protein